MSRAGRQLVPRPDSDGGHMFSDPSAARRCRWRPSSSSRHKQIHFSLTSHVTCALKVLSYQLMLNLTISWMNHVPIARLTTDDQWWFLLNAACLSLFINEHGSVITTILHSSPFASTLFTGTEQRITSAHVDPPCLQFTKASEEWKLSSQLNTINPNCLLNKLSQQLCLRAVTGHPSYGIVITETAKWKYEDGECSTFSWE